MKTCTKCGISQPFDNYGVQSANKDPMLLAVDHDHNTNQVRALLCQTCNFMLGHAQDDVAILADAIKYLTKWGKE